MNDKVVYLHRRKLDNKVFYVGIGYKKRAYDFSSRNKFWINYVKKYGNPIVEIYKENLKKEDACKIEIKLIKQYGRRINGKGHLVNLSTGGEMGTIGANEKRVICLKKGVIYNSMTHYCTTHNIPHSTISCFLNSKKYNNYKIDYSVRFIIDNKIKWIPYFDGDFNRKENIFSISSDVYYNEKSNENKILIEDKLNKLSDFDKALLYLLYNQNLSNFCKKHKLSYHKLYNRIKNIKTKFISKNKISYNKPLSLETKELILTDYNNKKILTDYNNTYAGKTKTCSECRTQKTFSNFHKSKNRKYGLAGRCKKCSNRNRRLYYINKKTKINDFRR